MNEEAKIQLSGLEMELVNNTEWIFTKQLIIKKVYQLLGQLHDDYKKVVEKQKPYLPKMLLQPGGKISKGENYQGLPYVILDYPALFNKENIFAVRTMFWWGNFFSISLHLSGENFWPVPNFLDALTFLRERDFSISVNESQWHHHFHPSNFVKIDELSPDNLNKLTHKSFLKIAKKTQLTEWNSASVFLKETFEEIMEFIKFNFPAGEIDL